MGQFGEFGRCVLPIEILPLAIPLSLIESIVPSYIVVKLSGKE
jgi:hypothetical protein